MKVSYTGRQAVLPPAKQARLDARFAKLSKMIERKGEKEAHVVLTTERHLHHAEVTLNVYDRSMVAIGSDADEFTALCEAIDKLDKQITKLKAKRRDGARSAKNGWETEAPVEATAQKAAPKKAAAKAAVMNGVKPANGAKPAAKVYRVDHRETHKPITLAEAVLEIGREDYLVYRDAEKDCVSVLVRRKDGHFDLIESA